MKIKKITRITTLVILCILIFSMGAGWNPDYALAEIEDRFVVTEEECNYIKSLGRIDVAVDNNFVPLSEYDENEKCYSGASVELFETIADAIGLEYQYVMEEKTWSEKIQAVKDKKIQLLFPVSKNEERSVYGCYSDSYYETYYSLITLNKNEVKINTIKDIQDAKIGVTNGTSIIEFLQSAVRPENLRLYPNDDAMYKGLMKGEVDYGCQNERVYNEDYYFKELFDLKKVYKIVESPREYCYYFEKGFEDQQLIEIFNRAIDHYNSAELVEKYSVGQLEIMNRYVASLHDRNVIYAILVVSFAALVILIGAILYARYKQERLEYAAKLNEIAFLQAQIKPHFLYNTLSAIAALCSTNPQKAEELTIKLSRYMRIIFQTDNVSEWIPLQQEIRLIQLYLEIEKARHGDRLQYNLEVDIDDAEENLIMPLVIQPIVENAVKHGALQRSKGGWVDIHISTDNSLMTTRVCDSGSAEKAGEKNTKDAKREGALANIRRRLMMEGGTLEMKKCEGAGLEVTVTAPIRKGKSNAARNLCR